MEEVACFRINSRSMSMKSHNLEKPGDIHRLKGDRAGAPPFLVYRLIGFSIPHDNEGGGVAHAFSVYRLIGLSILHDNGGAPSFAESAVLVFALGAKGGSSRM